LGCLPCAGHFYYLANETQANESDHMLSFVAQRLLQSVLVMLPVGLIAFSLFNYVGDPINNMVGQDTSVEERDALKERLGLNDPFIFQFGRFVRNAIHGEFGFSYQHRRKVSELIADLVFWGDFAVATHLRSR
jgi:ABC-type dipeptide/oligopeptide/nickel transport system permease component